MKKNNNKKTNTKNSQIFKAIKNILFMVVVPFISFYLMECYLRNPWDTKWGMKLPLLIMNYIFWELVAVFLFGIIGKLRASLHVEEILCMVIGLADYYVQRFRGKPILPWDYSSMGTAASVAGNYDYKFDSRAIYVTIGFVVLAIVICFADLKLKDWKKRVAVFVVPLILLFPFASFCQSETTIKKYSIYDKLFTPTTMTWKDGTAFAFIYELQFMNVDVPEGYDAATEEEILASLETKTENSDDYANIIVIMCEAFADPKVQGDFSTNQDYMPFIHSLLDGAENTISGYMSSSVIGGNTPNTEFEFLTGNSLAFLPQGCIPYQQFVTTEIDSMPSYLSTLGYSTLAMHPYKASGWDRNRVYPLLGFDDMHFEDYFTSNSKNLKYVRKYISDETLFEQIEAEYEANKESTGLPFFSFNVTMQNHSEYSGELVNFEPDITVDGLDEDTLISRYLSLEHLTDTAFEELVNYFEGVDDKTVIVFFGDHQASDYVVEPIWKLNGKTGSDLSFEDMTNRYKVPFVIWANYDIEEESGVETSANYLGNMALKAAGVPLDSYRTFIDEFSESYPVLSAIHAVDAEGNDTSVEDADVDDALGDYRRMQYYEMFDNEN